MLVQLDGGPTGHAPELAGEARRAPGVVRLPPCAQTGDLIAQAWPPRPRRLATSSPATGPGSSRPTERRGGGLGVERWSLGRRRGCRAGASVAATACAAPGTATGSARAVRSWGEAVLLLPRGPVLARHQGLGPRRQGVELGLDLPEVGEPDHALGAGPQLPQRLWAAQHQHGQQRQGARVETPRLVEGVAVAQRRASVGRVDEARQAPSSWTLVTASSDCVPRRS